MKVSPSEEALETSTDIGGPGPLLRPHVVPPLLRPHVLVETAFGAATGVNAKTVLPVTSLYSEPKHVTAKSNLVLSSTTVTIHAIARSPMKWFVVLLLGQLVGIAITVILNFNGYTIFPFSFGSIPANPAENSLFMRDSLWQAVHVDASNNLWTDKLPTQASRSLSAMPTQLIYYGDSNCLTKTNLYVMRETEQKLLASEKYKTKLCLLKSSGDCQKPRSVLRFFDGTYEGFNVNDSATGLNIFRIDANFERISQIIGTAWEADGTVVDAGNIKNAGNPNIKVILQYNLGKDFSPFTISTKTCRSMFYSGIPLLGYRTDKDRTPAQESTLADLQTDIFNPILAEYAISADLKMVYQSSGMQLNAEKEQRKQDYFLCIGSAIFLLIALWIQTRSLWIAIFSLIGTCGTYFWSNLVYRIILNFYSFAEPQVLAGFIVAQLGAFQVVYMTHVFRLACAELDLGSTENRLNTMMSTTHRVILSTSVVMMLCFFVSAASGLVMAVNFAVFCGLLSIFSYLTARLYLPAVIVTWHVYWQKSEIYFSPVFMTTFFQGKYVNNCVAHKVVRWLLLSVTVVIVAAFLIGASVTLKLDTKLPSLWQPQTAGGIFAEKQANSFGESDQDTSVKLYIICGLTGADSKDCHNSDTKCLPEVVYDKGFDLTSHTNQNAMLKFSDDLMSLTAESQKLLAIRRSSSGNKSLQIQSFIAAQNAYLKMKSPSLKIPFNLQDMSNLVASKPLVYKPAQYVNVGSVGNPQSGLYYRSYEMSVFDWISTNTADYEPFSNFVGGSRDPSLTRTANGNEVLFAGLYGDSLRYAAFVVNLTINTEYTTSNVGLQVKKNWENYMNNALANAPAPLTSCFASTPLSSTWSWLTIQEGLVNNFIRGIVLSLMFLFIGVTLATGNYVIGLFATLTSLCVVFMVLGILGWSGYSLGVIESIVCIYIVPMSAIPLVAITLAFQRATSKSKQQRLSLALGETGPALLFCGVSGQGISVFLFGTKIKFIFEFGVVFFATTGLASFFSLIFLSALLGAVGPVRTKGYLWDSQISSYGVGSTGSKPSVSSSYGPVNI